MICRHLLADAAAWLVFRFRGRLLLTCARCGRACAPLALA